MSRRRSPLQKALHAMAPHRVLWRVMSGPEVARAARSAFGTSTRTSAASRKKQIAKGKVVPTKKTAAKKTPTKKTAKRADPYAAARAAPGQNRQIAAKQAKAATPGAAKKAAYVRKKNGQFDGRQSMSPRELAAFERAEQGYVDPQLRIRNSRTRRG